MRKPAPLPTASAEHEVAMRLGVTEHHLQAVCALEVVGELDRWTAPALQARLAEAGPRVLVDLTRLQLCDADGLQALADGVRRQDARFAVLAPQSTDCSCAFEAADVAASLPLARDLEDGLERLNA